MTPRPGIEPGMVGGERSQRSLSLSLTDVNMDFGLN